MNWLFVEAVNISTDVLLPGAHFTLSNGTWTYSGTIGPLGFGAALASSGLGYLPLADGLYHITVAALGFTISATVSLSGSTPLTVPFWFPHGTVSGTATVPINAVVVGLIVGPIAATATLYPLLVWYRQRQAKAAEEQKRITL
jgi:hypothetical protein